MNSRPLKKSEEKLKNSLKPMKMEIQHSKTCVGVVSAKAILKVYTISDYFKIERFKLTL